MTIRSFRPLLLGLVPLALSACMNPSPAEAGLASASPSIGVDLGSSAGHMAARSNGDPVGSAHQTHPAGEMQMAHEGHAQAQASGTLNSVDAASHKINISHGPIQALGWPSMTMDFPVAPSVDLKALKPGSRVNFTLEKGEDGMPVVQSVRPSRKAE